MVEYSQSIIEQSRVYVPGSSKYGNWSRFNKSRSLVNVDQNVIEEISDVVSELPKIRRSERLKNKQR